MLLISFAMTSDAYADGSKTETRRFWKPQHAAKFTPGREFMGWTKDPRAGGVRMHPARVVSCKREFLHEMTEDSFQREGGTRYWRDREDYIECMGGGELPVWVLRFEHLPTVAGQGTADPHPAPSGWKHCEWSDAEQYRSRILTGSLGLEGSWDEWADGRPEKTAMNREYEYRRRQL